MNHIFRSIWNVHTGTCVAVSELTSAGGSTASAGTCSNGNPICFYMKTVAVAVMLAFAAPAWCGPVGGAVVAGSAAIAGTGGTGNSTLITQSSQNAVINWQSFNVRAGETVRFVQPDSNAVTLNRVIGPDPSAIFGTVSANGKVFLVNPNGILFGKGASVNVGSLIASTANISDSDFMAGRYRFTGAGAGTVVNQGTITAGGSGGGGYVALLGATVSNEGTIAARLGSVALAAGNTMTLDVAGDGLLQVAVNAGAVNALASNGGLIQADGGQVLLTAKAAGTLLQGVVTNSGVIQAQTMQNRSGRILLLGDMQTGVVNVGGTLDASAPADGNGGFIETSAAHVKVADTARITTAAAQGLTGSWLIDPHDFTVAASGGDMTGTALSANLGRSNVTIQSSSGANAAGAGNVNVNDAISWSADTNLTLTASNHVNVNASITATGANAGIALNANTANGGEAASGTGTFNLGDGAAINLPNVSPTSTTALVINGASYRVINSLGVEGSTTTNDLQGMNGDLNANYALGSNIDASATSGWNTVASVSAGFTPVGNNTSPFTATFDGLGHTVSNLSINRPSTDYVGLFGYGAVGSTIRNVGMVSGSVVGGNSTGGLIGRTNGDVFNSFNTGDVNDAGGVKRSIGGLIGYATGKIDRSYATGNVSGGSYVGGLIGESFADISNSHATGAITGNGRYNIGGLVGGSYGNKTIVSSYATGTVTGTSYVGGLSGGGNSTIANSYATGAVTGAGYCTGGLIGCNSSAVSNSYATGAVTGASDCTGGLIGCGSSAVSNSYATGTVTGAGVYTGGLIGYNPGAVSNSYATGAVSASGSFAGGLVGANGGVITNSYWDTTRSGYTTSAGGTGLTTAQMQQQASFTGFDLAGTWFVYEGLAAPLLRSFLTPLTVTAANATQTYNGAGYSGGNGVLYSTSPDLSKILGTPTFGGTSQGARNVGTFGISVAGLYSSQQGYLLSYGDGTLSVTPKALTVTGTIAANKVYDGTTTASLSGGALSGVVGSDAVTLSQVGTFASKNAGTGIAVTASDSISGAAAGNYLLTQPTALTAIITPKALTVTGSTAANKVYDGTTMAIVSGGNLTGVVAGDTVSLTQAGSFASQNVGSAIAVTTTDSLGGASSSNYTVIQPSGLAADITAVIVPVAPPVVTPVKTPAVDPVMLANAIATAITPPRPVPPVTDRRDGSGQSDLKPILPVNQSAPVSSKTAPAFADLNLTIIDGGLLLPPELQKPQTKDERK